MSPGTYASLRGQNVIMFPLVQDARRVAVTNFAWAPQ